MLGNAQVAASFLHTIPEEAHDDSHEARDGGARAAKPIQMRREIQMQYLGLQREETHELHLLL